MSDHYHGGLVRSALERNVNVLSVATRLKPRSRKERCSFPEQNVRPAKSVLADSFSSRPPPKSCNIFLRPLNGTFMCSFETAQKVPLQAASIKAALPNVSQASTAHEQSLRSHRCVALEFPALWQTPSVPPNAVIAASRYASRSAAERQRPSSTLCIFADTVPLRKSLPHGA